MQSKICEKQCFSLVQRRNSGSLRASRFGVVPWAGGPESEGDGDGGECRSCWLVSG